MEIEITTVGGAMTKGTVPETSMKEFLDKFNFLEEHSDGRVLLMVINAPTGQEIINLANVFKIRQTR